MEHLTSFGFYAILIESFKLLPKNGKLTMLIAIFSIVMHSILSFLLFYCIDFLISDILVHLMPDPTSFDPNNPTTFAPKTNSNFPLLNPSFKKDLSFVLIVEIAYIVATLMVAFLSGISIIIVSIASYSAKSLSLKELLGCIRRTWTRPLITTLYIWLLTFSCLVFTSMLISPLLIYNTPPTIMVAIVFGIGAYIFLLYLNVPWLLAIVISVAEENYSGLEALGKASTLIKGKRVHGFLINVSYCVFSMVVVGGCKMILLRNRWLSHHVMVYTFFVALLLHLTTLLAIVAYTVLYIRIKKIDGEDVELSGSILYAKLPTIQPYSTD
ncbi:uncharacterized protein LOC127248781 [Andrographis paniculata]|uniref:uncharacterized protein LOC127248781 n=1 Tax=Andrographis paniculata TaxID=175694 RepID=UPI0021E7D680|nr:uncharacterized protein LOC127248781 [Andrographis paniculata]